MSGKEQTTKNFQEHAILQSISDYISKQIKKTLYQILPLSRKEYVQELVQTTHSWRCLKVLYMLLNVFQKLEVWLTSYISLRKSRKTVFIMQKLPIPLQINRKKSFK